MYKAFIILLLISIVGCDTKKVVNDNDTTKCHEIATVKDFTGLDGCAILLVLENGDKYLPAKNSVAGFTLKTGQKIRFGYKAIPDAMSICMAEKMSIELTCAEVIKDANSNYGKPEMVQCIETEDPSSVKWMKDLMDKHNLYEIVRYNYKDGWAYHFKSGPTKWLYDCQGTFLCDVQGKMMNDCVRKVNGFGKGLTIWQASKN